MFFRVFIDFLFAFYIGICVKWHYWWVNCWHNEVGREAFVGTHISASKEGSPVDCCSRIRRFNFCSLPPEFLCLRDKTQNPRREMERKGGIGETEGVGEGGRLENRNWWAIIIIPPPLAHPLVFVCDRGSIWRSQTDGQTRAEVEQLNFSA